MKKQIALLLVLVCILSLTGCLSKSPEETVTFHGRIIQRSNLSEDTLQWLEHYNELTEEDQHSISFIPADLRQFLDLGTGEDVPAETE